MKLEDETQQETDIFQQAILLAKENQRLAKEREQTEELINSLAKLSSENPNPVLRIGQDKKLLYANPPALPLLNNKLLKDGTTKTGDQVPLEFQKMASHAFSSQSIQQSEIKVGVQTFHLEWVPILSEGYVNVYGRDITERKKAEAKLQAQAKQQAAITKLGHIALTRTDLSDLMNQTVHLLSQVLKVEYSKILKYIPKEHAFLIQAGCGWKEGLAGKARVPDEVGSQAGYTLRSDGPVVVKDLNRETRFSGPQLLLDHEVISGMSVIILSGSQPFGVLGVHTKHMRVFTTDEINFLQSVANVLANAIERKKAEQALRESEARANAVLNHALEGIITIDEQGIIHSFNPSAERIFGYKLSEILGENVTQLIPEDFRSAHEQGMKNYLETGVSKIIGIGREAMGLRKDGSTFPIDLGLSEIYLGETRMFNGIIRDITERKETEAQKQMQYELTRIFLDGQSLEKTIPKILQAVGEFMQWEISHYWELNSQSQELHCQHAWNADYLNGNEVFKEFKTNTFDISLIKGKGLPGWVWEKSGPFWIPEIRTDKNFPRAPFAQNLGMKVGFGFPIISNNQFTGVIEIFTSKQCPSDDDLIQFMANLGGQIGQWMHLKKAEEQLKNLKLKNIV